MNRFTINQAMSPKQVLDLSLFSVLFSVCLFVCLSVRELELTKTEVGNDFGFFNHKQHKG